MRGVISEYKSLVGGTEDKAKRPVITSASDWSDPVDETAAPLAAFLLHIPDACGAAVIMPTLHGGDKV